MAVKVGILLWLYEPEKFSWLSRSGPLIRIIPKERPPRLHFCAVLNSL